MNIKPIIFGVLFCLLLVNVAFAAVNIPKYISVQGRLTDYNGGPITGTKSFIFEICQSLDGSDCTIYTETKNVYLDQNGVFNALIGPVDKAFDKPYWLKVSVDNDPLTPRVQITSSAYAYTAAGADDFVARGTLSIGNGNMADLIFNQGLTGGLYGRLISPDSIYTYINGGYDHYFADNGVIGLRAIKSYNPDNELVINLSKDSTWVYIRNGDDTAYKGLSAGNIIADNADITAGDDISFYGEIMPDNVACSVGQILKKTADDNWDCATDATGTGGTTDHGTLTGLADDDHTQYLEIDGTDKMSGSLYIEDSGSNGFGVIETVSGKTTSFGINYLTSKYVTTLVTMGEHTNNIEDLYIRSQDTTVPNIYVGDSDMNPKYKIWTEGNDGSGSGLDADTIDGKSVTPTYEGFSICGGNRIPMGNLDGWMTSGSSYTGNNVCTHYGLDCKSTQWFSTTAGIGWSPTLTTCGSTALQASWYPKFTTGAGSYIACCSLS